MFSQSMQAWRSFALGAAIAVLGSKNLAWAQGAPGPSVSPPPAGTTNESSDTQMKHPPHVEHSTAAAFIQHKWKLGFGSDSIAEDHWKEHFPEQGSATFIIDVKGNWQFQGSFPKQPRLKHKVAVAEGIGIKNNLGTTIAFVAKFKVDKDGGSFSRSGHDAIVSDLWKDVSKHGHKWYDYGHASEIVAKHHRRTEMTAGEPQSQKKPDSGDGGIIGDVTGFASTAASDVSDVVGGITDALGAIGSIF